MYLRRSTRRTKYPVFPIVKLVINLRYLAGGIYLDLAFERLEREFDELCPGVFPGTVAAGDGVVFRVDAPTYEEVNGDVINFDCINNLRITIQQITTTIMMQCSSRMNLKLHET
eukprot:gene4853-6803_t